MTISPEAAVVLECARPRGFADDRRLATLLEVDLDWSKLVGMALAHGVSPQLADRLTRVDSSSVPSEILEGMAAHLADNRERNESLARELLAILDALEARGVKALPFKGQTLGAIACGDFTYRRAGDVDLLVRRADLDAAGAALESLGFEEATLREIGRPMHPVEKAGYLAHQCEYAYGRRRDGLCVEPHWAVVPPNLAADIDFDRFWARAQTVELLGRPVATLALPDLLLVLCVHAAKHEWTRLQWVWDVAALVERHATLDVEGILADARSRGLERIVLIGLGLADALLGATLPPAARVRMDRDAAAARLVGTLATRIVAGAPETSPVHEISALRMAMRERLRDRVRYAARTVFTPTEKHYRMVNLPVPLRALYVPIKLAHDYVALPAWRACEASAGFARGLVGARRASGDQA